MRKVTLYNTQSAVKYIRVSRSFTIPAFDQIESEGYCSFYSYLKFHWCNIYCGFHNNKNLYCQVYSDEAARWRDLFTSEKQRVNENDYYDLLKVTIPKVPINRKRNFVIPSAMYQDDNMIIYHIENSEQLLNDTTHTSWCTHTNHSIRNHLLSLGKMYHIHTHEKLKTGFNKFAILKKANNDFIIVNSFGEILNLNYILLGTDNSDHWFDVNLYNKYIPSCIDLLQ